MGTRWESVLVRGSEVDVESAAERLSPLLAHLTRAAPVSLDAFTHPRCRGVWSMELVGVGRKVPEVRPGLPGVESALAGTGAEESFLDLCRRSAIFGMGATIAQHIAPVIWLFHSDALGYSASAEFAAQGASKFEWGETRGRESAVVAGARRLIPGIAWAEDLFELFYGEGSESVQIALPRARQLVG